MMGSEGALAGIRIPQEGVIEREGSAWGKGWRWKGLQCLFLLSMISFPSGSVHMAR